MRAWPPKWNWSAPRPRDSLEAENKDLRAQIATLRKR